MSGFPGIARVANYSPRPAVQLAKSEVKALTETVVQMAQAESLVALEAALLSAEFLLKKTREALDHARQT